VPRRFPLIEALIEALIVFAVILIVAAGVVTIVRN
jgi:hypothetical protein